jgi:hypothetical protein
MASEPRRKLSHGASYQIELHEAFKSARAKVEPEESGLVCVSAFGRVFAVAESQVARVESLPVMTPAIGANPHLAGVATIKGQTILCFHLAASLFSSKNQGLPSGDSKLSKQPYLFIHRSWVYGFVLRLADEPKGSRLELLDFPLLYQSIVDAGSNPDELIGA